MKILNPDEDDWLKLRRVGCYLLGTLDRGLVFAPGDLVLRAQVDASHNLLPDGKALMGYTFYLGTQATAPFATRCSKHKSVPTSSTHAELMALFRSLKDLLPYRRLCAEIGISQGLPTECGQDNQSTIKIAEKGSGFAGKTKHFAPALFWVSELIGLGDVRLVYIPTWEMVPDGFTKPLPKALFLNWCEAILLGTPFGVDRPSYSKVVSGSLRS
jgi:hypothetical protein